MRILLVEPNKLLASGYRQALEQAGHDVDWQCIAQAAIHAVDSHRPDVIVLELQMSSHNGVEFLYELRSYSEWRDIPVVILSLVPRERLGGMEYIFERLGIVDYLYKPTTKLRHLVFSVEHAAQHHLV